MGCRVAVGTFVAAVEMTVSGVVGAEVAALLGGGGLAVGAATQPPNASTPPPMSMRSASRRLMACALAGLSVIGVACTAPAPDTGGAQPVPTIAAAALVPTATSVSRTPVAASATSVAPTPVPPTATLIASTRVPPTVTVVLPTPTAVPPTAVPSPTPRSRPPVADAIHAALANHAGTIGVVFHSLKSGETVSVNADVRFSSASLYKLFVLETAEAAIDDGSLDPAETLTMTAAAAAGDPYFDYLLGTRVSADCALQTMIQMSGNGAADLLLHRFGSAGINARIKSDGLTRSAISADGAFTSPADVASVLESIARGEDVSPAASQRMLDLLSGQQQNDRVPAPLPLDVRIAHKTGELPDLRHDAAIVFAPSATYVLVVLVEDAPSESAARSAIVDVSRAVYDAVEPAGLPSYLGLPPRLAQQAFRLPDAAGRLAMLGDPRTETGTVPSEVARSADAPDDLRLRPEVFADLIALQRAASQGNAALWVRSAFEQPTDAEAAEAVPTEWVFPCAVEQPARTADRRVSATEAASARPRQVWLGTVLSVTDRESGAPSAANDRGTPVWQWLEQHAADFGFVPALPEAPGDTHSTWSLRWVGRDMARRLMPFDTPDFASRASAELARAEADLAAQDPRSKQPPAWGLGDACWTIATNTGQGCPSRWYFLELPLS